MRSSPSPVALGRTAWTTFEQLSWPVKILVGAGMALGIGFLMGNAALGPVLSDNSPDNAAAVQARFERRTVDPQGHYPDPHPYRAQSPDFGPHRGPAMGAHARQQAQRQLRGHGAPASAGLSPEAAQAFGAARPPQEPAAQPQQPAPQRSYDRHTGVSY
jgi:hypothetical protein